MKISCNKCGGFVDVPTVVRWEENFGYVGKHYVCRVYPVGKQGYRLATGRLITSFALYKTLDGAKAEAQRLFDEWMGGLWDG